MGPKTSDVTKPVVRPGSVVCMPVVGLVTHYLAIPTTPPVKQVSKFHVDRYVVLLEEIADTLAKHLVTLQLHVQMRDVTPLSQSLVLVDG